MASATSEKKRKKKTLRRLSGMEPFELAAVPGGANGRRQWIVVKEDQTMKIDLAVVQSALDKLAKVATVLKSGEPAQDVVDALANDLAQAGELLASMGLQAQPKANMPKMKQTLTTLQERLASVAVHERDIAVGEELDDLAKQVASLLEELNAPQEPTKSEPAAPPAEQNAPAQNPPAVQAAPEAEPPAPEAPAPAPTPAPAPEPAKPEAPAPEGAPVPPAEELVSKADFSELQKLVQGSISALTGVVNKLGEQVVALGKKVDVVHKQADPGMPPSSAAGGLVPKGDDYDSFPFDLTTLAGKE